MAMQPFPDAGFGSILLLATDRSHSVLAEAASGLVKRIAYSAYGSQQAVSVPRGRLGFNGELRDRLHGWYHLGNGHRIYNPVLRRFHSPDRLSPFAEGGLNPYTYCLGDPVNYTDPTGRAVSWEHIVTGATLFVGMMLGLKALLLPALSKKATAKNIVWLKNYFDGKPPILGSRLGGLEFVNAVIGIGGAIPGFTGVGLGSVEEPEGGVKAASTAFMAVNVVLSAQQILGRAVVQLYPVVPKSAPFKRGALWIHGKHKVEKATDNNVMSVLAQAPLSQPDPRRGFWRVPYNSPASSPSPPPVDRAPLSYEEIRKRWH